MTQALGWFGSTLIVASLVTRRPVRFRLLNLGSAVVLLVFNLAIGLWSMVTLNMVILVVNAWQLASLRRAGTRAQGHRLPAAVSTTSASGAGMR